MSNSFKTPCDELQSKFLQQLAKDLQLLHHKAKYEKHPSHHEFIFSSFDTDEMSEDKKRAHFKDLYSHLKHHLWQQNSNFITKMEALLSEEALSDGNSIDPNLIRPEIVICRTNRDKAILRYCLLYQGLTATGGVARRFGALVYDTGQTKPILMGAIYLASTAYALACRDEYLGWSEIDSRAEAMRIRHVGLRRMMQLSVCIALPPYNHLLAGKLFALLSFSTPIQKHFEERYGDPLLAIITTSVYGPHAAIFNRIMLRRIPEFPYIGRFSKLQLFKHIGETAGYTTAFASEECFDLAKELVTNSSRAPKRLEGMHVDTSRDSILSKAISLCGLSRLVFQLNRKGVLFGCLDAKNVDALRTGNLKEVVTELPVDCASVYWKAHWLTKAIENPNRCNAFKKHKVDDTLLRNLVSDEDEVAS